MDDNNELINELNKFLKGIHMGATTFKDYHEKAKSPFLRKELKETVESFKRHEEAVTHRIEQLGGNAADSVGLAGKMGEFFEKMKLIVTNTDEELIDESIKAMEMGIKNAEKFVEEHRGIESSIKKELDNIIKDYYHQIDRLRSL